MENHKKYILIVIFTSLVILLTFLYLSYRQVNFHALRDPPKDGEIIKKSLMHEGINRKYLVYKPSKINKNPPLVIYFHGSLGTGENMRNLSGFDFDYLANEYGFVVVYPDGYENHWNDCRRSASYSANLKNIDDVGFVKALISQLKLDFNIDPEKVIASGFSNGGHMVYRLAMEAPESIFIAAPIAANMPVDENLDCVKSELPVHITIFNGTEDPINPYEGGLVEVLGNKSRGEVLSSEETLNYWAGLAKVSPQDPTITNFPDLDGNPETKVSKISFSGQRDVSLYRLEGSGHVVPSKFMNFGEILGGNAKEISAAEEIFSFYKSLTLKSSMSE